MPFSPTQFDSTGVRTGICLETIRQKHTGSRRITGRHPPTCEPDSRPFAIGPTRVVNKAQNGTRPLSKTRFYPEPTMPGSCSFSFVICLTLCHPCFRTSRCLDRSGICNFRIAIRIGRSDDCDHDEWFLTLLEPLHNGHPPEATAILRKPARLHTAADLELVSAAMASYGGAGVARSLYYYRTGEVLDYPMIRRLKNITRNSTMARGSAAQELLSELRFSYNNVTLYI